MTLDDVVTAVEGAGLAFRGAFHPRPHDLPVGVDAKTIALAGFLGGRDWAAFRQSVEASDGAPDPLDRWSRRVVGDLARELGAAALFPFGGPPWLPFQRWAGQAEGLTPSPLGILVHPEYGLWHSWRGALAFRERIELPQKASVARPCDNCADKPCLSACPVGAFGRDGYDAPACAAHLSSPAGGRCMNEGCLARLACPVGVDSLYSIEQRRFHMKAFAKAAVDRDRQ